MTTFTADLTPQHIKDYLDAVEPRPLAMAHLGTATTRIIYDLDRYRAPACCPQPPSLRETHISDLGQGAQTKMQLSFSYSDGFGREIQKKIQAEPGPVPQRDANGKIIVGADGQPQMTANDASPRWVGSGWTIFNNKGKPVRQYEPFFSATRTASSSSVQVGVSPVLFYDPVERVVATLHPNHTYEKVVFDPWQQTTYDVNDTVLNADGSTDPNNDPDVSGLLPAAAGRGLPAHLAWLADRPRPRRACATRYPDATTVRTRPKPPRKPPPTPTHPRRPTSTRWAAPSSPLPATRWSAPATRSTACRTVRTPASSWTSKATSAPCAMPIEQNERRAGPHRHALRLRHARQPHPPGQHGGRRALDAERRGRQAHPRLGQPRPHLPHRIRPAAPPAALLRHRRRPRQPQPGAADRAAGLWRAAPGSRTAQPARQALSAPRPGRAWSPPKPTTSRATRCAPRAASRRNTGRRWTGARSTRHCRASPRPRSTPPRSKRPRARLEADTYTSRTTYDALNRPIPLITPHSDQPGSQASTSSSRSTTRPTCWSGWTPSCNQQPNPPTGSTAVTATCTSSPTSTTTPRASASASTTATAPAPSTTTTRSPSA